MVVPTVPPKTLALVGAVCLTIGWLLASVLAPPVAKLQTLRERRATLPVAAADETPSAFAEQLHWKSQQAPLAPTTRRNPFIFGSRTRALDPTTLAQAPRGEAPIVERAVETPVVGPTYSLSGIGVSETTTGQVRTAVISDGSTVYVVKVGDSIGGYHVAEVTNDSVTLTDASGVQSVVRLRH